MNFLRKQFPIAIAFVLGMFTLMLFFIPAKWAVDSGQALNTWITIASAFGMVLGINSIIGYHMETAIKRRQGYGYSLVLLLSFLVMTIVWIPWWHAPATGSTEFYPWGGLENPQGAFTWMYFWMMVPMQATVFAILAFYIASAAYRSFRAKSAQAFVLLIAAVIVMLGRVPLGTSLTSRIPETAVFFNNLRLEVMTDWLLNVPNAAGFRGILLGVALGVIATSVRIMFGIERTYMGGGE
jgi:hypothetical protein